MKSAKFLPELSRNRFRTTWVQQREINHAEAQNQKTQRSDPRNRLNKRARWVVLTLIGGLAIAMLVVQLPTQHVDLVGPLDASSRSKTSSSALVVATAAAVPDVKDCDGEHLSSLLSRLTLQRGSTPRIDGYTTTSLLDFGGSIYALFSCQMSGRRFFFRAVWSLESNAWKLKEISRPPSR